MRISTNAIYREAVRGMIEQQAGLSKTQHQITTGKRISTPSEDPVAHVHTLELDRAKAELEQYGRSAKAAIARLNVEEQALADSGLILQRVRELAIQSNSGSLTQADRDAIAVQLEASAQQLLDLANRKDGAGEFLFSGFATHTQPFVGSGGGVTYAGDQGVRQLQIGPTQRVADSHSGYAAFIAIAEGNGTFVTSVNGANTGTGVIDTGSLSNAAAWVRDTYTLSFTTPTTWQVVDSSAAVVATGAYTSAQPIAFNGAQVNVTGTPATGDSFTIAASEKEDIFTTLDNLIDTVRFGTGTPASRAQAATRIGGSIEQLDQAEQHLLNVRADVGARLNSIDDTQSAHESFGVELDRSLSELRDLDYAEAISRLDRQLIGLEAAQKTYAAISRLSLFDYL